MPTSIQKAASREAPAARSINQTLSALLDTGAMRKRFDELLGKRAPQFISSLVALVNATPQLQQAVYESPMTVIQSALKAAVYDLPIESSLGYAYLVPFRSKGRMEAAFVMGWKGMHQLAMRTGAYRTINVTDVREGELVSYNRLTEEIELDFLEDEDEREALPIVGYVGYFRLVNGMEKTVYMTRKQIEAHEKKNRKGEHMTKGWREDFDAMALKTVYRRLIGKYGLMSIDYRTASPETVRMAQALAEEGPDAALEAPAFEVDARTGEVLSADPRQSRGLQEKICGADAAPAGEAPGNEKGGMTHE